MNGKIELIEAGTDIIKLLAQKMQSGTISVEELKLFWEVSKDVYYVVNDESEFKREIN